MENEKELLEEQIELGKVRYQTVSDSVNGKAKGCLGVVIGMTENFDIQIDHETAKIRIHDKHELSIFNRGRYGGEWDFKPELSWFSSSATSGESTMLDYLIAVGKVANDMKNPQGFCCSYLKELIVELKAEYEAVDSLINKRNTIVYKERLEREKQTLAKAIDNLRTDVTIEDDQYRLYKDTRHNYPFKATLKILTATDKTVTINVYRRAEDVCISTKRVPREEFLQKYTNKLADVK